MIPDYDLIQEIKNGSHSAMEVLVKRYYKQIYAFVYRRTGDKDTAYDLTQEIFIKMMKSISTYKERAQFKTWLYTLAVNHCNDYFRSKAFQVAKLTEEMNDSSASPVDVPFIFERKEKRRELITAIKTLPDYQCNTILLRYYHDFTIKEIAGIMKTNDSTVKSRLRQGLEKLKGILQRGDDNDEVYRS
ncbi:RNA polymerase sigma factor [Bacillus sp. FJAT-50079]|uniref:RNA polymerase sigma factor n=1 Tax=Bacillus sp. FJAT-50079 TaxID=2833577 RepID=UPI001BC97C6E|nr:RNA polymerase sigma factor [Bacillus sp. FJAT-50079]MBS4208643.1 RNA polymerase sigma factor [Bacillus sp. FJAT-50079]